MKNPPIPELEYITYPKAYQHLKENLGATREELAVWLFLDDLNAYLNINELDPPPKFHYNFYQWTNYIAQLNYCWFIANEINNFQPVERYITGKTLIERWAKQPDIEPALYICAKIRESRLQDIHPIWGLTRASETDDIGFPPLEDGLFEMSKIKLIETEDFGWEIEQTKSEEKSKVFVGLTKQRIMNAFADVYWDRDQWEKYLATSPKWLIQCRVAKGNKKVSAIWNPTLIALALLDKKISLKRLDLVFMALKDWKDEWQEKSELFR